MDDKEKKELHQYVLDQHYRLEKAYSLPQNELIDQCSQERLDRMFNGRWVYERDL